MKKTYARCLVLLLGSGVVLTAFVSLIKARAAAETQITTSARITVQAAGQGNPWINLQDGVELADRSGGETSLKETRIPDDARPQELASADFDEDGVPDLISGYSGSGGGLLTLHRGNVDSIYPNSSEAQRRRATGGFVDSPFLFPARVFEAPVSPELLGVGDFDADGHWDIVIAARGGDALHLMPGDGQGSFAPSIRIALSGGATALQTGEINSADGLADLVVAVKGEEGSKALVFESPNGALTSAPEVHALPTEATALALGRLDDDFKTDLAVAAGNLLLIVHGRDRKLSLDEASRAEVLPAEVERRALVFGAVALAIGDFTGDEVNDIALLSVDGSLHVLEQEDATESLQQQEQSSETDSQFIVAAVTISQAGQLGSTKQMGAPMSRAAASRESSTALLKRRQPGGPIRWRESTTAPILQGPTLSGSGAPPLLVQMRVSGLPAQELAVIDKASRQLRLVSRWPSVSGQSSKKPDSAAADGKGTQEYRVVSLEADGEPVAVLPMRLNSDALSDLVILQLGHNTVSVVLSAPTANFTVTNTNNSGPGSLRQAIIDADASAGADEIRFNIPGNGPHTIKPLTMLPRANQTVTIDGTTQPGFAGKPVIELDGSQAGIEASGLELGGLNTVVRGLVINRFIRRVDPVLNVSYRGIGIEVSNNNIIEGNFIGTDVTGTLALGNQSVGVNGFGRTGVLIGGTTSQSRNLLSGNFFSGVGFSNATFSNVIQGNFIGTDITGTKALNNPGAGVTINGSASTVGGTTAGARNVIAGSSATSTNVGFARSIFNNPSDSNLVQGNFIGIDLTGTKALGTSGAGAVSGNLSNLNLIGGTTPAARNIISGHQLSNVQILDTGELNKVQGNYIGTDVTGTKDLGNGSDGVFHGRSSSQIPDASRTSIGGAVAGAGNLISGNGRGVVIQGSSGADANGIPYLNFVQGNFIGTDVTGKNSLGNSSDGVYLQNKANSVVIGGANIGEANVIAFNGGRGVFVDPGPPGSSTVAGTQNVIRGNSIFSNGGLGIDLAPLGVTDNDTNDPDQGPNLLQNFPVLTSATTTNGSTTVQGTLNSTANTSFTIEFFVNTACNASGNGEGRRLIGSTIVTTSGNDAIINVTLPNSVTGTESITATATNPSGNTSEFSACVQVGGAASPVLALNHLAFDDTAGNNNGRVDLNECVRVYATLTNVGPVPATGLSAVLSAITPGVTIVQANSPYPNLAPGALGTNDTPFRLITPPALACGAFIDLTLQVTTNEGTSAIPLRLRSGPLAPFTFTATGPVLIPDNNLTGIDSPVSVSGINAPITKVRVKLHIKHLSTTDLDISLIGPDGTTVDLSSDNGGSGDNYGRDCPADDQDTVFDDSAQFFISSSSVAFAPFIGTFAPEQFLSGFNGKTGAAVNGIWKLHIVDDSTFTGDTAGTLECWRLEITSASCADGGGGCGSTPPNSLPTLSINDVSVAESNSDTAIARFTVSLSAPSLIPLTVQFTTADGSATAPGDYITTSGALTIPPGVTSGEIAVPVIGDLLLEPDETFSVTLSNPNNATIADAQAVATIVNDERPEIVLASVNVDDSGANNNGKFDPNECVRLNVTLRNQGTASATGISAVLSSSTTDVTLTQASSAYEDIAASGIGNNLTPFQLSIATTAACGVGFNIALQVTTDQGSFPLLLQLEFGAIPTDTFGATGPVAIPDNNPTGVDLPINVSGVLGPIRKVIVKLHITHTSDNNLDITLIGPDGTTIILSNDRGVDGDNYGTNCPADGNDTVFDDSSSTAIGTFGLTAPFVGTFKPQQALAAFIDKSGTAVNGEWKLHVVDDTSGQTGSIQCAALVITSVFCADGGGQCNPPSAVNLISFAATAYDDGVMLEWQTGFEADNLGFNIYRDENGSRAPVNRQLVAGSALRASSTLGAGQTYAWWDTRTPGCGSPGADCSKKKYWLEDVDLKGLSTLHGPFYANRVPGLPPPRSTAALLGEAAGHLYQSDTSRPIETSAAQPSPTQKQSDVQTALAGERAAKISIRREGWYRVAQPELASIGFDTRVDPRLLQLFVDGRELPILVRGGEDGRLDPSDAIEFYGLGLNLPFTDSRVYWLVAGSTPGLRITQQKGGEAPPAPNSFAATIERRDRTIYFSALRNGETENFFGAVIAQEPVDQSLTLAHVAQADTRAIVLEVALQGVTLGPHSVNVELNGANVGVLGFDGQSQRRTTFNLSPSILKEGQNVVRLTSLGGPSDVSLVDFIRISYQRTYTADNNALKLTAPGLNQVAIDGFTSHRIRVVDVTNPDSPQDINGVIEKRKDSYAISFSTAHDGERSLLAFTAEQRPAGLSLNLPSNLRGGSADYVVITRRDVAESILPLVAWRQAQGLSVALVHVDDIYDEFSFGQKTPFAVKAFLSYAKSSWKKKPRFVLFAGDATFDPKDYLGFGNVDLVPTKLVDTDFMETSSDDWLADFDGDGVADLAIGRLPARFAEEMSRLVSKIISYEQSGPSDEALLVADTNDGFDFEQASAELRSLIPGSLRITQINRGRLDAETARSSLLEGLYRKQFVVNYAGHGSINQWRGNLLTNEEALALRNDHLSMFVMMTCLNGYFHDPALDSLGESLLKAERGGAVAVWASSGMTFPEAQTFLNQELYQSLFNGGPAMTIGEAVIRAKLATPSFDIRRTWILLGDPATRLR